MNHHADPSRPLGIISAVIPVVLIAAVLAATVLSDGSTSSLAYRLAGLTGFFVLGIGTGLGIAALIRRRSSGEGAASRIPAVAGIVLSGLIFLLLSLASARRPVTAEGAAPDAGLVEDVPGKDRPLRVP
jgi:hypothetical protein